MWWPRPYAAQLPEKKTSLDTGKRLSAWLASRNPAASSNARLPSFQPAVKNVADTEEDCPLVKGSVSGVDVTFLVDTGANITIVKPSVVSKIPASDRPNLEPVETSMRLADGSSLPFVGRGCSRIQIGNEQVVHEVWVAEMELDGIIGMDLIKKQNCRLTLGQGRFELALHGKVTECVGGGQLPSCARVAAQVTTVIRPRSESLVPAKLIDPCGEASVAITEGQERFTSKSQVLVATMLFP